MTNDQMPKPAFLLLGYKLISLLGEEQWILRDLNLDDDSER